MSGLFFDSSTLISMAVTCSLPILRKLKESYDGDFSITNSVYQETIGRALSSLRFRYEGHRIKELIDDGIIKIYADNEILGKVSWLMDTINQTYLADGRPLKIMHLGETTTIVAAIREGADSVLLDERTARLLIENPEALKPWLDHKLHTNIVIDKLNSDKWQSYIYRKFVPLRSTELALAAWFKGIIGNDKDVLFGLLWALKFAGCAITEEEIDFYMKKQS